MAASNTWPGTSSACAKDNVDSVNKPASKLADDNKIRMNLLPRFAFAENSVEGAQKNRSPRWASGAYAVRTASVSLRWHDPVQVRRVSISGPLPGHPQRKLYTQCLYNIGHTLTRGNARPCDHFLLMFAPQDSRTISDGFKVICRGSCPPSNCSNISSMAALAIAS